jgi:tetratricopeptide (TPR) repeat protein
MPLRISASLILLLLFAPSAGLGQSPEFVRLYEEHLAEAEADPDDAEKWVMAGLFAGVSLRPHEAIRILEGLEPSTIPPSLSQLYWVYLTSFSNMACEHERELAAAREYEELFPDGHFQPYLTLRALASLGRVDKVEQLIESIPDTSDELPVLLYALAGHFRDHGYAGAADELKARELAWYEGRPLVADEDSDYRLDFAAALYRSTRWKEAEAFFLELAEEDLESITPRAYLGLLAARKGDVEGAARADGWLADHEVSEEDPGVRAMYRARMAAVLGDIERAVALLEQALEEGYRMPAELRKGLAWDFEPYLDHPAYRYFLRPRE